MMASLHSLRPWELLWLFIQVVITVLLQHGYQFITVLPFIVVMLMVQHLNKLGFLVGVFQGLLQAYFSPSLPYQIQNLTFGLQCLISLTRNYIPHNLQGEGWTYLFGLMCYVTLGLLQLGLYLSANDIAYTKVDLYYLGGVTVASLLMANGLTSTWQQWLLVQLFGLTQSFQFQPLIIISVYGYLNWQKSLNKS